MQIYDININENQMETTSHGTDDFPLAIYETVLNKNILGFVDWHWHNEIQFCFVTSGKVRFTVNGFSSEIGTDGGIFINSGVLHTAKPITKDASYVCIDASPIMIKSFSGSVVDKKYISPFISDSEFSFLVLNLKSSGNILRNLYQIHNINKEKTFGYEIVTTALLMMCWKELIISKSEHTSENTDYERLKSILSYIHNHYSEKITLDSLSNEIHLCPSECCRYFKKHMGCTIFEYINNYRLSESTALLISSEYIPISAIAYEYGFGSTSYYIDKFKKKTGITPLAYRKAHTISNK